ICVRLYSEEDYAARPEYTDPEILRTNLASVILQMADLRLGEVEAFPFIDPPDRRQIADGLRLLEELGAVQVAPPAPRARAGAAGRARPGVPDQGPRGRPPTRRGPRPPPPGRRPARLPARGGGHRRRAVHPGPPGAAGRPARGRRRQARPVRRRALRLPRLPQPVGLPAGEAEGAVRQPVPPAVPRRVPQLPAGAGVA